MGSSLAISGCLGWVSREVANPWWRLPASGGAPWARVTQNVKKPQCESCRKV